LTSVPAIGQPIAPSPMNPTRMRIFTPTTYPSSALDHS
jgi:hypothetical protein